MLGNVEGHQSFPEVEAKRPNVFNKYRKNPIYWGRYSICKSK
jgi:hypothetical protein